MKRLLDLGLLLAVVAGVVAAFAYLQLDLAGLFSADSLRQMGQYAVRFLQPDLSGTYLASIARGALETLAMSALGTLLVVQSSTPTQAVAFISMALFCVHFAGTSAWGLVQVMVAEHKVASVAAIQNFGSFVFASFAPIVTGWVVDTTHSFNLALVIAAGVTFAGALCYFFIVKTRID